MVSCGIPQTLFSNPLKLKEVLAQGDGTDLLWIEPADPMYRRM